MNLLQPVNFVYKLLGRHQENLGINAPSLFVDFKIPFIKV